MKSVRLQKNVLSRLVYIGQIFLRYEKYRSTCLVSNTEQILNAETL